MVKGLVPCRKMVRYSLIIVIVVIIIGIIMYKNLSLM